jgi:hypothetical protein
MSERTFISYAREDQDFVLDLATRLKQRTVPIWLDQWDIPPGADWDQSIETALHQCGRFIIVLSPAAVASKQVRGELQTALDENKLVVPVCYRASPLPRQLRLIQNVDFSKHGLNDEHAIDQLAQSLRGSQDESAQTEAPHPPIRMKRNRLFTLVAALSSIALLLGGFWYWSSTDQNQIMEKPVVETRPEQPIAQPQTSTLRGSLQVNVNADMATVSIDGTTVGVVRRTVPLLLEEIGVGQHRVRIEAQGYEPQERRVTIVENESSQEGFRLWRRAP